MDSLQENEKCLSTGERWGLILFVLLAYFASAREVWWSYFVSGYVGGDFQDYYYFGAWMLRHHLDYYSPGYVQGAVAELGFGPWFPLFHLPVFFLVFVPFTFLPHQVAEAVWFVLCHLFLIVAVVVLLRDYKMPKKNFFLFMAVLILWQPLYFSLLCGQVLLLVLLLLVLLLRRIQRNQTGDPQEALLLSFVILLKIQFLPLFLFFLWSRRSRTVAWSILILLSFALLSFVLVGNGWIDLMLQNMVEHVGEQPEKYADPSLWMTAHRLFEGTSWTNAMIEAPWLVRPVALLVSVVMWSLCLYATPRRLPKRGGDIAAMFGFFLLTMILTHPVNVFYSFIMVLFVLPEVIDRITSTQTVFWMKGFFVLSLLGMNVDTTAYVFKNPLLPHPLPGWVPDLSWSGCLLLWVLLLIPRLKRRICL